MKDQIRIYCRTELKGKQTFYLAINGKSYFLFMQDYRKSNKEFFAKGVTLDTAMNYSLSRSTAVRKTMTNFFPYIRHVERENNLVVLRKTLKAKGCPKKNTHYKRQQKFFGPYFPDAA